MLYSRAARVATKRGDVQYYDHDYDDGIKEPTLEIRLPDDESRFERSDSDIESEVIRVSSHIGVGEDRHVVEINRLEKDGRSSSDLRSEASKDHAEASLYDHRGTTEETAIFDRKKLKIVNPAMVGDIAANILNRARGRVARAEQDAATKQDMIDFVNNKKVNQ